VENVFQFIENSPNLQLIADKVFIPETLIPLAEANPQLLSQIEHSINAFLENSPSSLRMDDIKRIATFYRYVEKVFYASNSTWFENEGL